VSDGVLTDTGTVTLTVNSVNDAPVAVDDYVVTYEDTPIIIELTANDYDVDGDWFDAYLWSYSPSLLHGHVEWTLIEISPGVFRHGVIYTPDANWHGEAYSLQYGIQDIHGATSIASVYITVNSVPDIPEALDDNYVTDEDIALVNDAATGVLANDYDGDGDVLTASLVSGTLHGSLMFNGDGSFTYTPDPNWFGIDSFTYEVSDGTFTDTATVTITVLSVNDLPVAVDDYITTDEDTPIIIEFTANDYDVDGDWFDAYLWSYSPSLLHGHIDWYQIEVSPGVYKYGVIYTPDANWHGEAYSLQYGIQDSHGATASASVYITVIPVNDAPVAVNDAYITNEDTILQVESISGLLANDFDVDGDVLTAALVSGPNHGILMLNPGGSFSYTPDSNWFGEDSFIYEVSDGVLTDTATVTITVLPVNDAPVAVNDTYSTLEDVTLIVAVPGVLANDYDVDGDLLSTVLLDMPLHGIVLLEPDGALTYIPDPDYYGFDTFTYQVFDGMDYSNIGTVIITVIYVNTPPIAFDDAYTTEAGVPLFVEVPGVLDNDYDVDEEDTLEAILIDSPLHGTVILHCNGSFTYAPNAAWCGVDTFTYNVFDGREYSNIAVVTITIIDVTPPVTTIHFTGVEGEYDWYHSDVEVTLTATDDCSGVASTVYSLNGSTWMPYTEPFFLNNSGEVTVYYYSTDNAGNVEDVKTATIKIGKPTRSFVTGGGWICDSGGKGYFGFVVKYKCGILKGHLIYIFKADGYKYIVKSTHWFGMAIDGNHALLEGKAKILRYSYETRKWECFGNFYFRVEIWDNGRCERDVFQIQIFADSGELFHEAGFDPLGEVHHGRIRIHERGPKCWCRWPWKKERP
jgi:VCBS repeat-containing protein